MEKIIGLKELRENTESYITKIKKGGSFVVVKKSKPVFKISPVDEWSDDGIWETVVDFTDIKPEGVAIGDVRSALKELKKEKK